MRRLVAATLGRRLLVRIWLHGVLLFAGMLATIYVARFVMPRADASIAMHVHPYFTVALADRVLARRDDPAALARELAAARSEGSVVVSVFRADGTLVASATDAPPSPVDTADLAPVPGYWLGSLRVVVGAFDHDRLVAYAIATPVGASPTWHLVGLLAAALALALVFVALPLTRSIARPLEQLGGLARELGSGNLAVRAPDDRRDEIGDLARSFNAMAKQIAELRSAERELLADISHELRTPLARMRVVLELASDADPDRVQTYLREVTTDLSELEQLLDAVITSSRLDPEAHWQAAAPPLHRAPFPVGDLLDATTTRFRARWPERELVCTDRSAGAIIDGDPVLLRRALDNLVDNARKYSPDTSAIELTAVRDGASVRIEVVDHGIGIAQADQARLFTPFFRADRSRTRATGGVGLGLALARRIAVAHGGSVGCASELGHGSRFWFAVPLLADDDRE